MNILRYKQYSIELYEEVTTKGLNSKYTKHTQRMSGEDLINYICNAMNHPDVLYVNTQDSTIQIEYYSPVVGTVISRRIEYVELKDDEDE